MARMHARRERGRERERERIKKNVNMNTFHSLENQLSTSHTPSVLRLCG